MREFLRLLINCAKGMLEDQLRQGKFSDWYQPLYHSIDASINLLSGMESYIPESGEKLVSIFTCVKPKGKNAPAEKRYVPLKELSIDFGHHERTPNELWESFLLECERIPQTGDGVFETFLAVFKKHAWNVKSQYETISVYELFKAIAAITHCFEQNPDGFLIISIELGGISSFLRTMTSKGALKDFRGRSFYLQLLMDAIVRFLLLSLGLSSANIITNIGGRFNLLAPAGIEGKLREIRTTLNRKLLKLHFLELFVAIDWVAADGQDLINGKRFVEKLKVLKTGISSQKRAKFSDISLLSDDAYYESLFSPFGSGGKEECCAVCDADIKKEQVIPGEETLTICTQCHSFQQLASELRQASYIIVEPVFPEFQDESAGIDKPRWHDALKAFGLSYQLSLNPVNIEQGAIYKINDLNFLPERPHPNVAYDFRFFSNVTPHSSQIAQRGETLDKSTVAFDVKSLHLMAETATGVKRYGLMIMALDISYDELFFHRLQGANMLRASVLSAALELFFSGWLNPIVHKVAKNWAMSIPELLSKKERIQVADKLPDIIFSDVNGSLLIAGPWDVLPLLAQQIRNDFAIYATRGKIDDESETVFSPITMSASLALFHAKEPVYHAQEIVQKAKDLAQEWKWEEKEKDAIHFLDTTVPWERFESVKQFTFRLVRLIERGTMEGTAPRNFLWLLSSVANLYAQDLSVSRRMRAGGQPIYGEWMWRLTYGVNRLGQRLKEQALKEELLCISNEILNLESSKDNKKNWRMIEYLKLPVRWAEYLMRSR